MSFLPNLSALSLKHSHGPIVDTDALVAWNTDGAETRLLASFHEAVALRLGLGVVQVTQDAYGDDGGNSDEDPTESIPLSRLQKIDEDRRAQLERERGPISKRKRARTMQTRGGDDPREPLASNRPALSTEYRNVCWWLRLCLVPSQPGPTEGTIRFLDDEDFDALVLGAANLAVKEIAANTKELPEAYISKRFIDAESIKARVADVNGTPKILLQLPVFGQLTSGRTGIEDAYMQWLRKDADCAYTEEALPAADDKTSPTSVEHVVAKNWLHPSQVLKEFAYAENDPVNIVWTRKSYNQSKGTKALHFGALGTAEMKFVASYAPEGFVPAVQSRMARKVAYMFLTYPLVSENKHATRTRIGSPKYAEKFNVIRRLCTTNMSEDEVNEAWVVYALFRVVNPLVVSSSTRMLLADPSSWLSQLLFARMYGSDFCSDAVIDALSYFGVGFGDE